MGRSLYKLYAMVWGCFSLVPGISSGNKNLHLHLMETFYKAGVMDSAITRGRYAAMLFPGDPYIYNMLGASYIAKSMSSNAEGAFALMLKNKPRNQETRYNLGLAYEHQAKWQEAYDMWKQILTADPQYPGARAKIQKYLDVHQSAWEPK